MEKAKLIDTIETLYPADSRDPVTQKIGQELLLHAISKCWRDMTGIILQEYAKACLELEEG